ncbi:amino-acid N-acetyltransferase [Kineococcus xinjiangensis]|uniref:Amino-acid N-acetyltransferase n=1 Tax=Kineococcus xinjiangensis TaxID=512762 RepID=A0A2S6IGY1_9ACTN|nr:amino-acid N-acetyltransferase [Kineococcus xinjiangensis]PPK93475.1 amino-acid N-acetyltransferase [Kineococcus xinjiangensis]
MPDARPDQHAPDAAAAGEHTPGSGAAAGDVVVRRARTRDVPAIRSLVETYAHQRILLAKEVITLYEAVQEFVVAEIDGRVVGCGALHVLWEDLGEVRTLAVSPDVRGRGVGHAVLNALLERADDLGLDRLFCLTFETAFFAAHGFSEIEGTPVSPDVYAEMLRSHDEGVAEFLDLARVKPNTLGNTRMLRVRPAAASERTPSSTAAAPPAAPPPATAPPAR